MNLMTRIFAAILFFLLPLVDYAQSTTVYTGIYVGAGGAAEFSDTLYLGPGTYELDGNWDLYSQYVTIDAAAIFIGTGTLRVFDPGLFTGSPSTSYIDGNANSNAMDVYVELINNSKTSLTNITLPADLSASGWSSSSSSSLYIGKDLAFAGTGTHLILDNAANGDLRFDPDASITGYGPSAYVITNNSIQSHVVKEGFSTPFVFPVGIAENDYTPSRITNTTSNTVHVSVQDYTASASIEQIVDPSPAGIKADGINRTWHIFADLPSISSTVTLQHNAATEQSGYDPTSTFVTQYSSAAPNTSGDFSLAWSNSRWQNNIPSAVFSGTLSSSGTVPGAFMQSRTYASGLATSGASETSYFSESSDINHPLPLGLTSFDVTATDCKTIIRFGGSATAAGTVFTLERSYDGTGFSPIDSIVVATSELQQVFEDHATTQGPIVYRMVGKRPDGSVEIGPSRKVIASCPQQSSRSIMVAPNPSSGRFTVSGLGRVTSTVSVINAVGVLVISQKTTADVIDLNISDLAAGTYTVKVERSGSAPDYQRVLKVD